jgi:hypothetical protein
MYDYESQTKVRQVAKKFVMYTRGTNRESRAKMVEVIARFACNSHSLLSK